VTLGEGADIFDGEVRDFDGDVVKDFQQEDQIVLRGEGAMKRGDMAAPMVTETGATLSFDSDDDGVADTILTLEGDFSGGDFMVAEDETGAAVVTFEPFIAPLVEGTTVSGAAINGVINQMFLTGVSESTFEVTIDDMAFGAFSNSLGYYEIDTNGVIFGVSMLSNNVKADAGRTLTIDGVDDGATLGFFIVQDGAAWANGLDPADTLEFLDASGQAADVDDDEPIVLAVNGERAGQIVFHSYGAALNTDGAQHALSGVAPGGEALTIGFEDILGGGDNDFQDVVFTVEEI
jgi:hypothetical protein